MKSRRGRWGACVLGVALSGIWGCAGAGDGATPGTAPGAREPDLPAYGSAETLDLGTWNLEWFGDAGNGPPDEEVQLENVARVIRASRLDVVAVQEVVGESAFERLVQRIPGYSGLLADDARVERGAEYYSDFGGSEQKVGLIYRDSAVELLSARVILPDEDHAFAGRPPLELHLQVRPDGPELFVVVLHAKAGAGAEDYARRRRAASALKSYLDTYPTRAIAVLGDFNDDMDVSIFEGSESPYEPFVADTANYRVPTRALSVGGQSSTVRYPDVIDHHIVTDEVWSAYLPGSAAAIRAVDGIPDYGESTSDHFPVASRYRM